LIAFFFRFFRNFKRTISMLLVGVCSSFLVWFWLWGLNLGHRLFLVKEFDSVAVHPLPPPASSLGPSTSPFAPPSSSHTVTAHCWLSAIPPSHLLIHCSQGIYKCSRSSWSCFCSSRLNALTSTLDHVVIVHQMWVRAHLHGSHRQ
jgi:hypothetical protein